MEEPVSGIVARDFHTAADGEVYRADIKTPSGIIVEVQHSAITDQERLAREVFYGNLVWVIDGRGFRQNFDIYRRLPAPTSDVAQDIVWVKAKRHMPGANAGLFFRLSDSPSRASAASKASVRSGLIHSIREIEAALKQSYVGHHQFDWVRPRRAWLEATCPIVTKNAGERYRPGKRAMQKFKIWKTIDAVVAGIYEDDRGHVEHLLLGLYDDAGLLNYIGRCRSPGTEKEIRAELKSVMGGEGFSGHKPQPVIGGRARSMSWCR